MKGNPERVYAEVTDFRNFAHLLPAERISDVEVTAQTIRFELAGMGRAGLMIERSTPHSLVVIKATEDSSADVLFRIQIAPGGAEESDVTIELEARLNMFIEMMARGPLQQVIDLMVDKLAEKMSRA